MANRIRHAFESVQADEELLQRTSHYLHCEAAKRREKQKVTLLRRWNFTAVAAILLVILGITGYQRYRVPVSYVSIDVNPSVELTLNRANQVLETFSFNAEGEQILNAVSLRGKRDEEAVKIFLSIVEAEGYLPEGALVSISVQTATEKEAAFSDRLMNVVEDHLDHNRITAGLEVFSVQQQVWEEAHRCHMSPAKYLAIQELLAADEDASLEEYSHHSIQQIRRRTQEYMQNHSSDARSNHAPENARGHNIDQTDRSGRHGH